MNLSKVRVVARVKDVESAIALERFRPVLERCGEFVIVTPHSLEAPALDRLADFDARVVTGTFTEFVREVGRNARTADHLLVFGCTGTLSELSAYSQYETGLRALVDSDAVLAAAIAHLESSAMAGALASPLTNIRFDMWSADWREAGVPLDTALPLLGIDVPLSPEKSAWGPLAGIILAAPGMLAADWDAVANMMSTMPAPKAEALFTSLIPFILQSHDRLLVFSAPQQMAATGVFANYLQQALRIGQSTQRKQTTRVARAARVYHNSGAGYIEEEAIAVRPRRNGAGSVTFSWQAPSAVESVRFDPVEGAGVICRGVTAMVDGAPVDIVPFNCLRVGSGLDVFITPDSIYDLRGVTPGASVVVTMDAIDYIDPADFAPPLPEADPNTFGGALSPALAAAQVELAALREARDALRDAHSATLGVRLRRRARAMIARVRARVRRQLDRH